MKAILGEKLTEEKWDEFVTSNSSDFGLLQSWVWGEFQKKLGRKVFRLGVVDEQKKFLAVAQIVKHELKFGRNYFYIPRGPVIASGSWLVASGKKILEFLFSEIEKIAKQEQAVFLRLDPAWENSEVNEAYFKKQKFVFSGQVQPKQTLILDLTKSEDELLKTMKPKTRYNIKVAQKHCLQIDAGENYFEDFWKLMKSTAQRDKISIHSQKYYWEMIKSLGAAGNLKLIVAKDQKKVITANLVAYFGDWCVYLHGASDYDVREKMAPYLLQWETITDAKTRGLKYYDFWGVDSDKWPGVTRFKTGFVPQQKFIEYLGSWDLVYSSWWHFFYKLARRKK